MDTHQANLLITDDDRDFRESLGELLTRRGFKTLLAENGEQAVEIVQNQSVHVVLVDMHMPKLSGLETLAVLRQLSYTIPSILMSAKLDDSIVQQARALETAEVLAKPFSGQTITSTLRDILRNRYGWDFPGSLGLR